MADNTFHATFDTDSTFNASFDDGGGQMSADFGDVQIIETGNYNNLSNKPKINTIPVEGDKTGADYRLQDKMQEATVAEIEQILYLD